jgi:hypothetical protein
MRTCAAHPPAWPAVVVAGLLLAGCGGSREQPVALGRSLTPTRAAHTTTRSAEASPAPVGDPSRERDGQIPQPLAAAQDHPAAAGLASSPVAALRRYALAYTNWQAAGLPARERELAKLAIGAARLTADQTAAAQSGAAALIADHVANAAQVVAIAPGQGPDAGEWVIVTEEQTTGSGAYAGLPAGPHVTLARVTHLPGGWAVSEWDPIS